MRIALLLLLTLLTTPALARPTSYADSWMGMLMHDGMESSASLTYSPTPSDAIGLRSDYLRHDDAWLHSINYNRLLKRWNEPGAQANLYLLSGLGAAQRGDSSNMAGWAGMMADWESRRYYVGYENRAIVSGLIEENFTQKARIGFAPYLADYDGLHTWLMLQVDHRPQGDAEVVVTPLIRLFTTEMLGEAGISSEGDVLFNLTTTF